MPTFSHEELCQKIVDHTQDAIIFADQKGAIRLWNIGAETIFGFKAEEVLGKSLDMIIPEPLRKRHWTGYHHTMATGITQYGRKLLAVPAIRKDGVRISVEFTIALLKDAKGEILGPAAILRDVTERWERDKAIQDKLSRALKGKKL